MKKKIAFITLLILFNQQPVWAAVRLPSIISNHMVLQQNMVVKIWGWSEPGEKISITTEWDTTTYETKGGENADWMVLIKTPTKGGPYQIIIKGSNKIVLEDVLIGEVWLCSGQSNMGMSLSECAIYSNEIYNANSHIRFFQVEKNAAMYPQQDVNGKWVVCSAESLFSSSAVAYFFGKALYQKLGVPVGLINASWGGTSAEVWTPAEYVINDSILNADAKKIKPSGYWPISAGAAFNGMIYPVSNFKIAGTIWYQGENNTDRWNNYHRLFTTMIKSWRQTWNDDFPFYFVQIAPYNYPVKDVGTLLREAQTKSLTVSKTGMVVISDLVSDTLVVHPKQKKEVGERLANYALADSYGFNSLSYKNPMFKTMEIKKNKVKVYFDNVPNGLISRNGELREFFIAGIDQNFVPAMAKIKGSSVIIWSPAIKYPVAVRFGFRNCSIPNLFSKEDLPACQFRTDNWNP